MYTPSYGFGPGTNAQPYIANATPYPPHPAQGQQPQMMYNPLQHAAGPHQTPYASGPEPGMGATAGGIGMVQNNGMAHVAGGHVPVASYQTPYSSSPYGATIPTSSAANLHPNFMPTTSGPPSSSMNASNMNLQQMQAQRMQPPQSAVPTQPGQRVSPYGGINHSTPPNASNAQSQFNTPPQNPSQPQLQTPISTPQNQAGVVTPQTANFSAGSQGTNTGPNTMTPLSPSSEAREKDRVTLLLEINRELLLEVMRLQAAQQAEKQAEKKGDVAANTNSPDNAGDKDRSEKEKAVKSSSVSSREYYDCMRRLQGNLAYLAAIADRSHKPSSQIPAHPAIMSPPPLTPRPKREPKSSPSADVKAENSEEKKPNVDGESLDDREDRIETLKDQYKRLQALFPGVDPKHDVQAQAANAAARAQMQAKQKQAQAHAQAQAQGGGQNQAEQNLQQKQQAELYKQHMMQQVQQQAAAVQPNQSQGPGPIR